MSDVIRYIDSAGWSWRVCEVADRKPRDEAPHVAGPREHERRCLYFFSRLGTRRLRQYPESWPSLPRRDLEALCSRAEELAPAPLLG